MSKVKLLSNVYKLSGFFWKVLGIMNTKMSDVLNVDSYSMISSVRKLC